MSERTLRLLFVTNQFHQGGAERYLFELCRGLDRRLFDVHILTRRGVDRGGFYFRPIVDVGIAVHAIRQHVPDIRRFSTAAARWRPFRVARNTLSSWLARGRVRDFVASYDIVAFIQLENFLALQGAVADHPGVVVHLLSNRFQYTYDPYDEVRWDRHHRFVTCHGSQEMELPSRRDYETFRWPISMDFTGYPTLTIPPPSGQPVKIGIVTRLSREKPLEPLFRSFKALLAGVDATLHVYGGGDPAIFAGEIRALGIGERVVFEGHRPNLLGMLQSEGLSMCWLMSIGTLLGYASIEIAASGIPMVFWNFGSGQMSDTDSIRHETGGAMHSFDSVAEFAAFSRACLNDRARLIELGARLRSYMLATYDIHRNLPALQDYYLRMSAKTQ